MTVFIDGHSITCTVDEYIELKNKLNWNSTPDYSHASDDWLKRTVTCEIKQ